MAKKKLSYGWETREERLRRTMKIPAKKRLEWLYAMHQFTLKSSSARMRQIRLKLRRERSLG